MKSKEVLKKLVKISSTIKKKYYFDTKRINIDQIVIDKFMDALTVDINEISKFKYRIHESNDYKLDIRIMLVSPKEDSGQLFSIPVYLN